MLLDSWNWFVRGFRIASTRIVALAFLAVAMVTEHAWPENGWLDILMEVSGFILVMTCMMGRIWCSLYLAGYKRKVLIMEGPYSLSRNPLYVFNLIGALGVAFATETVLFPLIVAVIFAIYYRSVIRNEENQLRETFGKAYEEYAARVPVFFPKLSACFKLQEPENYVITPRLVRKELCSMGWFMVAFLMVHYLEWLRSMQVLPIWLHSY